MGKNDVTDLILSELRGLREDVAELKQTVAGYRVAIAIFKWGGGGLLALAYAWILIVSRKIGLLAY